ncbi:MAG: hypothetical protein JO032_18030 [Alphaproteobacteria bacterium]|nr:hypothetical protein [Alphaproteobacteria bacterium]MBV9554685.1 hypothetical protein [Alphaproteobacteria bacterium]
MSEAAPGWRAQAERERAEKALRLRRTARLRLDRYRPRRFTETAIGNAAAASRPVVLDSERYAAPLAERLGPRDRVQIVLWGAMTLVGLLSIASFFSAPLMDLGLAMSAGIVAALLVLSYLV